jgi:RNA polymerase-binding transcription factor DksA
MLGLIQVDGPARAVYDGLTDLRTVRRELEHQRAFRHSQPEHLVATLSSESSFSADEPQHQVILDLQSAATTALADIDAALHRIDIDTYGRCQQCDAAIPVEHLAVLPMVRLCMTCQFAREDETRRNATRAGASDRPAVHHPLSRAVAARRAARRAQARPGRGRISKTKLS